MYKLSYVCYIKSYCCNTVGKTLLEQLANCRMGNTGLFQDMYHVTKYHTSLL